MAVIVPMVKIPAVLAIAPLLPRPPVAVGKEILVESVKLERRELAELKTEEREEREEESSELIDESSDTSELVGNGKDKTEVVDDDEDEPGDGVPPSVEVGERVDVTEGMGKMEMEVGSFKQISEPPAMTVITGVGLPSPSESPRTITMLVPGGIVT